MAEGFFSDIFHVVTFAGNYSTDRAIGERIIPEKRWKIKPGLSGR